MAGNVICSKCGQANAADQTFCASCGAFLEWTSEHPVAGDAAPSEMVDAPGVPGSPAQPPAAAEEAPPPPPAPVPATPPPVAPVRAGPSTRSVPPSPVDLGVPAMAPAISAAGASTTTEAAEPTIACPACHRPNPETRTFCHSCGALLRPKPPEPAGRRRTGAGSPGLYRVLSIALLIAILLVGSFLLTRLTAPAAGSAPTPSPTGAGITWTRMA